MAETTDVLYIVDMYKAHEWVHAAIRDGDLKMLSVAYVSGFIGRCLLSNGSCDACNACPISEAQSPTDVYIDFKECSSTLHSLTYPTEKLVETVGTAVTVLEGIISEGLT
jgi:predicted metal-binding protein